MMILKVITAASFKYRMEGLEAVSLRQQRRLSFVNQVIPSLFNAILEISSILKAETGRRHVAMAGCD